MSRLKVIQKLQEYLPLRVESSDEVAETVITSHQFRCHVSQAHNTFAKTVSLT